MSFPRFRRFVLGQVARSSQNTLCWNCSKSKLLRTSGSQVPWGARWIPLDRWRTQIARFFTRDIFPFFQTWGFPIYWDNITYYNPYKSTYPTSIPRFFSPHSNLQLGVPWCSSNSEWPHNIQISRKHIWKTISIRSHLMIFFHSAKGSIGSWYGSSQQPLAKFAESGSEFRTLRTHSAPHSAHRCSRSPHRVCPGGDSSKAALTCDERRDDMAKRHGVEYPIPLKALE